MTEQMKSKKELIADFAHRMNVRICFEDDFQIDRKEVKLVWSDGYTWIFTMSADPIVKDEKTIEVNYRLNHTQISPTNPI